MNSFTFYCSIEREYQEEEEEEEQVIGQASMNTI